MSPSVRLALLIVGVVAVIALFVRVARARSADKMEDGGCAQRCPIDDPRNSERCQLNYGLCIEACGPDLTSKRAPPCIRKCKSTAATCRKRFLDCANNCGQLWVS